MKKSGVYTCMNMRVGRETVINYSGSFVLSANGEKRLTKLRGDKKKNFPGLAKNRCDMSDDIANPQTLIAGASKPDKLTCVLCTGYDLAFW